MKEVIDLQRVVTLSGKEVWMEPVGKDAFHVLIVLAVVGASLVGALTGILL